jgi:hypothetical protein
MWSKRMGSATATGAMSLARLAAIIDAYGGRPEHWPLDERAAALKLLESDERARDLVKQALRLDDALDRLPAVGPSNALQARILQDFEIALKPKVRSASLPRRFVGASERLRDYVWPGVPVWQLASALAISLVIGIVAGTIIPAELMGHDESEQLLVLDSGPSLEQEI